MYVNVVERVREAFKAEEVVRLDCTHVGTSDCKKIGVKLRVWWVLEIKLEVGVATFISWLFSVSIYVQDLVPCIPILFKDEQIILWRGERTSDGTAEH